MLHMIYEITFAMNQCVLGFVSINQFVDGIFLHMQQTLIMMTCLQVPDNTL